MEFLSRGLECSICKSRHAEYTLRDKNGNVMMYLCQSCAEEYAQNIHVQGTWHRESQITGQGER
jgi:protein-arginine kinase activator protein McsA